jgi:hypothetical protein
VTIYEIGCRQVRVQFQTSGGIGFFPGLAAPREIDVETLAPQPRLELLRLIQACGFFSLPSRIPDAPGTADHQTYQITIEDGTRRHSVVVSDPVTRESLQRLIDFLRTL